ncbi:hypothetical protein ABK040_009158 [Willaertia magna]
MEEKDGFLIPPKINENFNHLNNFEIYLGGLSTKGGLMVGEKLNYLFLNKSTFPKFLKFTKNNIPLQKNENIKLVTCGLQHVVLITNNSKCYLYGDLKYGSYKKDSNTKYGVKPEDLHFGTLLPFKMEDNKVYNQLECKITHVDSGEVFVIIKDELNRFWFCGKSDFGNGTTSYEFFKLGNGELVIDKDNVVTHLVAGGRHAVVCVNDRIIYTIGNNYNFQLGKDSKLVHNSFDRFLKVNWNLEGKFLVKQIAACGGSTIILTKCGKIFKTVRSTENNCALDYIPCVVPCNSIGSTWTKGYATSKSGNIYVIEDFGVNEAKFKFNTKGLNGEEIKLFSGNHSTFMLGLHTDNEVRITKFEDDESKEIVAVFRTDLPIVNAKMSEEIILIFCARKDTHLQQLKLFQIRGFKDINLMFN